MNIEDEKDRIYKELAIVIKAGYIEEWMNVDLFDAMLLAIALILILFFHRYVIEAILFTILAILYVCIYLPRRIWERINGR